jgi:NADH dehydrogenase [ubiquinone] 1 alpha subcomplex assembly factor 7
MPKTNQLLTKIFEYTKEHNGIALDQFMQLAIEHYYANHEPFGRDGDFITAPEVSQMFGEMIGVWCTNIWSKLQLDKFSLVEIGGGRGLLMKDLLRATKHVSVFNIALEHIYMVETSDKLIKVQQEQIQDPRVIWVKHINMVPQGNLLIIANEFFDALPIKQYKKSQDGWKEIIITEQENKLEFSLADKIAAINYPSSEGSILEVSEASISYAKIMADKMLYGAMLIIDYGYLQKPLISTLQAVKNHKYHNVFQDIGSADLTAHVDFAELINAFNSLGCENHLSSQGDFLLNYGIGTRVKKLIENGAQEKVIMNQLNRLVHPEQMGELFKVLEVVKLFSKD